MEVREAGQVHPALQTGQPAGPPPIPQAYQLSFGEAPSRCEQHSVNQNLAASTRHSQFPSVSFNSPPGIPLRMPLGLWVLGLF